MADSKQPAKNAKKPAPPPTEPFVVAKVNEKAQLCAARFSPCGKFLVAGGMTGQVHRWDAAAAENAFPELPALAGHGGWVQALEFARSGNRLYTGDSWGRLSAWDYSQPAPKPLWSIDAAHSEWLRAIAVSPDGKSLATCGRDRAVRLWDAATGKRIFELTQANGGHEHDVFCVAFAPDGKSLATGDQFGEVKLWNVESAGASLKLVREFDAAVLAKLDRLQDVGGVRVLVFAPDGKQLLVGGTQPKNGGNVQGTPTLLTFDAATGKQTQLIDFGSGYVYVCDVQFLPDGTRVVALSGNPGSGKLAFLKPGETKPYHENTKLSNCHAVGVHPSGKRLAVTAVNPNSAGNGRVKGMGPMDYPGNWSPVHIVDMPDAIAS